MSKTLITCHFLIQFQTNWLIRGAGQERDADTGFLTDFLGQPYLPGSTLKGKMRDAYRRLVSLRPEWKQHEDFLFGTSGVHAGQVYFHDGVVDSSFGEGEWSELRNRVAMDRYRRTVKDSAVMTEKVVKPEIPIVGTVEAYVSETEKEKIGLILLLCLLDLHSIGSGSSIGRGRLAMTYANPFAQGSSLQSGMSYCWLEESRAGQTHVWEDERLTSLITDMDRKEG